jgi:chemotaxis-related protein WspB
MLALTFQIGTHRLALDVHQVREVVPRIALQRVPGSPSWLAGLFVYRGRVVPVLDLHQLLDSGQCPPLLSSRIILVPLKPTQESPSPPQEEELLLGLLAAQVADVQEVRPGSQALAGLTEPGEPDLGLAVVDGSGLLHLIDVDRLLPDPVQRLLAALPSEPLP